MGRHRGMSMDSDVTWETRADDGIARHRADELYMITLPSSFLPILSSPFYHFYPSSSPTSFPSLILLYLCFISHFYPLPLLAEIDPLPSCLSLSPPLSVRDTYSSSLYQPIILGCVLLFNEFLHVGELYCMREDRCSRRDTDCGRVAPHHEFSTLHTLCHLAVMNVCEKLYLRCVLPDWSILSPPCTVCTPLQFILHELSPFLLFPHPFLSSPTF